MNEKVMQRVQEHADYVDSQLTNEVRIFTALQGSQNYQMELPDSDVDTKSVLLPSFSSLVFDRKHTSTTLEVPPTIEHADIKDVRDMADCWRKQNINFLEILFTKYVAVNKRFQSFYDELYSKREEIAHYNPYQALRAMCGHMMEKYHAFDHPYPTILPTIQKYGYCGKQLHHMVRFKDFLTRYFNGESYENCLIPTDREYLLAIKTHYFSLEEALKIREDTKNWMDKFLEEKKAILKNEPNKQLDEWLDELIINLFTDYYKKEI